MRLVVAPALAVCATLLTVGCVADSGEMMIDHEAWTLVDAASDPFADRPLDATCPGGWMLEGNSVEVDTGLCPYFTVEQPSLITVAGARPINIVLWHAELWAADPAEAHIAIQLGDDVLYEAILPIPFPDTTYDETVSAPRRAEAGTPVIVHIHNHGQNTWNLLHVMAL